MLQFYPLLCPVFILLLCLHKYFVMPYQAQMKADAMQGLFVQEPKNKI